MTVASNGAGKKTITKLKGEKIMLIKASAALRNDYASISALAKETKEPIYITKNGEGDLVLMSIDAFEKREQMLQLRARVLQAEQERIDGEPTISVSEARKRLRERASEA
ncbi:type II toxin-antitoxin system prevent-host-death family antitoxin [Parabacteroides goldsteinii]|uniref:type II toxin-antitoxin system prevent-host-death family antitoxin n=1 Tax=Parabacteroides goldsteinii TaxID=328812 RepID=UPI00256EBE9F|nr:type II toxin-antitoxin system prevent-host-death family antitoxin [Parabacteroides goldsteinii]